MISAKATEHLTGIVLEGEYDDFYEIVESIYRMTGLEESYSDPYWSVKNRLLGICYDIRHAYQGDRNVVLTDNGMDSEKMKWHEVITPKENVHYSVEILFPEAIFVALSAPELYIWSSMYYGEQARKIQKKMPDRSFYPHKYSEYLRDRDLINMLSSTILSALSDVIGDEEFQKALRQRTPYSTTYENYAPLYVDKCNLEYIKTPFEKRKDKIRNITKRLVKAPDAYNNMKRNLEYSARKYNCSIHELQDPDMDYPDDIEW